MFQKYIFFLFREEKALFFCNVSASLKLIKNNVNDIRGVPKKVNDTVLKKKKHELVIPVRHQKS